MNKFIKFFPYIILVSALLVSTTGSYYSIYGISKIFAGHRDGALMMAFALEFGNIVSASALKIYWNIFPKYLLRYFILAVIVLSVITSGGIFGYLSDGYEITSNKDKVISSKIELLSKKKERFESQLLDYKKERDDVNLSISNLRKSLSTDNQYQTVDKKGNVLTQIQSTSKKGVQNELSVSTNRSNELSTKIDNINDSISFYDVKIIEMQANNDVSAELGPLKYVSRLTGESMDVVIKWFLFMIMIVFQPLAIALILGALFAFDYKPKEETQIVEPILKTEDQNVVQEPVVEPVKKLRKKRKLKDDHELENPKAFTIDIEGLEPNEILFPPADKIETPLIEEPVVEELSQENKIPSTKEKKHRKRKVIERELTEDLAVHLSESLNKKKD